MATIKFPLTHLFGSVFLLIAIAVSCNFRPGKFSRFWISTMSALSFDSAKFWIFPGIFKSGLCGENSDVAGTIPGYHRCSRVEAPNRVVQSFLAAINPEIGGYGLIAVCPTDQRLKCQYELGLVLGGSGFFVHWIAIVNIGFCRFGPVRSEKAGMPIRV